MWGLKTTICLFIFSSGCLSALVNPLAGVICYMLVYQVHPSSKWWGIPLAQMGFRFSLLAALFTIMGLFVAQKKVPRVFPVMSFWELGMISLLFIGLMNTFVTGVGITWWSIPLVDKFWKMFLMILVINRMASERKNLKIILTVLVIGTCYLGYDAFTAPTSAYARGRLEHIGGPDFRTTSGIAAHMGAMLPLIGASFLIAKSWKWRIFTIITGALTLNTIFQCRTRSAFVGLAVGVVFAIIMAPRAKRFRIHILLLCGVIGGLYLSDDHFWHRMSTLTSKQSLDADPAARGRFELWYASLEIVADHPAGIGIGNFPSVVGEYNPDHHKRACHNTVLLAFTELGIQGGILFLALTGGGLISLIKCRRMSINTEHAYDYQMIIYGAMIAHITYFVTGLGTERLYCESFWWIMAVPQWIERSIVRDIAQESAIPALFNEEEAYNFDHEVGVGYGINSPYPAVP